MNQEADRTRGPKATAMTGIDELPAQVDVIIDVSLGSFIKRDDDGHFDYVSPLPCPFNYGSIPNSRAPDGDRIDAVIVGPKIAAGTCVTVPVRGMIDFVDAGQADPKWICAEAPLTAAQRRLVTAFFRSYGPLKGALNLLRGRLGRTAYRGMHLR